MPMAQILYWGDFFGHPMPVRVNDESYVMLCSVSAGNRSSAWPSRHGVRSPFTTEPSKARSGILTPGLFAFTFLMRAKNWSSSLFQSAVVHWLPLGSAPAQKWPLKCEPISWPDLYASLRSAISVGRSPAVFQLIDDFPGLWPGPW